ncbi:MAG: SDR family NAD(P)-dependent oxidoreductase [Algicola sp.]|nr:SDR family NAD(P)-dependent oxidoreductase [Algicola sp.]
MHKLALITGGSKGLGKSLVEQYLNEDWTVREFSRSGDSQHHIDCDFASPSGSAAVIEQAFKSLVSNDWTEVILINNVGTINPVGPINMDDPGQWQVNIQINLNSCILSTGLFLKHFSGVGCSKQIANISSGAASNAFHGWSLYCAAKAGLEMFSQCVALEQSKQDNPVGIFCIRPGVIDTDMQQQIRNQDKDRFDAIDDFTALKSEDQLRTPDSVATLVRAMLDSRPQSGEVLNVSTWLEG